MNHTDVFRLIAAVLAFFFFKYLIERADERSYKRTHAQGGATPKQTTEHTNVRMSEHQHAHDEDLLEWLRRHR